MSTENNGYFQQSANCEDTENFVIISEDLDFEDNDTPTPCKKQAKRTDVEIEDFTLDLVLEKIIEEKLQEKSDDNTSVYSEETDSASRNMSSISVSSFLGKRFTQNSKSCFSNNEIKISNLLNDEWENNLNDLKEDISDSCFDTETFVKDDFKRRTTSILEKLCQNVAINQLCSSNPCLFKQF